MTAHFPDRPANVQRMPKRSDEAQTIIKAHWQAMHAANDGQDEDARRANAVAADLIAAYYIAARQDRRVAITILDHMAEIAAPDFPELVPFWDEGPRACEQWVEWASEGMRLNMLAACLKRMPRSAPINPRKKALAAIWNTLPPDAQAAFLAHVRPETGK